MTCEVHDSFMVDLDARCSCPRSVPGIIRKPEPTPAATESARRKGMPVFDGCFMYFPDALLAIAEFSRKGNDKHNPGEPLHWARHKSQDQANCVGRHLLDIGSEWDGVDPEFDTLHAVPLAWRALALLQTVLEAKRAGMKVSEWQRELREGK